MSEPIPVLLARCPGYGQADLAEQIGLLSRMCALPDNYAGRTVLLKPNLISWRSPALACTNGALLAATATWFHESGARVLIGDSPAFGSARLVLGSLGIDRHLERLGAIIIEFATPRPQLLSHGVTIGVAEEALCCDLFVNLPKIKAHNQMYMTMAVKNLFGIVVGMRKAVAHMRNGASHLRFADLMLDLAALLPPSFTIGDAIDVMHRQGPVGGETLSVGCLAAGRDPVALDTALLEALELDRSRMPLWQAADRRAMPGCRPENLGFPLLPPSAFHGTGFVAPAALNPVPFNPLRFLVSSIRRAVHGARTFGG